MSNKGELESKEMEKEMNTKENILEAWIMVEHLSEGDIRLKDNNIQMIEFPKDNNFYSLFSDAISKKGLKNYQKGGIVLYLDIFKFEVIISLLREKFNLQKLEEEVNVGEKFSFALYFDKELQLVDSMTFFTASNYILKNKRIPKENEFLEYEEENKNYIKELFNYSGDKNYVEFFNDAFRKLLQKYSLNLRNCRMKVLTNLEADAINLHSFFMNDLEKAKSITTENLDQYLLGIKKDRINLDSRKDRDSFNPDIFWDILQPKNYPIARFPSNPNYALSFMQQVAVNLAIGYDNEKIRSVNGPPGTGKTTLLKDIFAQLVVDQANEIIGLKSKEIKDKVSCLENTGIGKMPKSIADKGILVASSNNGAVQNIVNELPLISGIDEMFIEELRNADYFWNISNSNISVDKNQSEKEEKFWGLFSLEGGKKNNMNNILTSLEEVIHDLKNNYVSNKDVYNDFKIQYENLLKFKQEKQFFCEKYLQLKKSKEDYDYSVYHCQQQKEELKKELSIIEIEYIEYQQQSNIRKVEIEEEIGNTDEKIINNLTEQNQINSSINALKLQKPWFFSAKKIKQDYKERMRSFSEALIQIIDENRELNKYKHSLEDEINTILKKEKEYENKIYQKRKENQQIVEEGLGKIKEIDESIQLLTKEINAASVKVLDMNADYNVLQMDNPWFEKEYRCLQSRLFIVALKLRKQFLYENIKSIQAAIIIWNKQKEYLDNKEMIEEAWNWMNMVIPVISTTFASVHTMCKNLSENTIGYLFVDEAGQALPQSSVGAIFRSKQVMVVGDPAQIKPVLTLDSSILGMLGEHYGVSKEYLSDEASTQTLVDDISRYGFCNDGKWIGIPLWVHRRCRNPMFNISNAISYGRNMVQSIDTPGKAFWFDISGNAIDKYVKEQGEFLKNKISELMEQNPDINDKTKKDTIYVITPFKNVAYCLSQELKKIGFTRYDEKGKVTNIGTVHTFQGREAPIVFFVLGCDERSQGAAHWAVGSVNPNILNVAATRAKEEFYIIGDKRLYLGIKSTIINESFRILDRFNS
ncbi:AAA domain-containing protein [uncultured Granulicatella sp.]|uniref:AAA domain-containing protein n=1 Tax=uncultured Granulicatella sp. TaxID=316089 RepID=UPI0028D23F09|nr:AAA domain-containing protein [uncultured Granulicatella sp.]